MRRALLLALCLIAASAAAQDLTVGAWPNGTLDLSGSSGTEWRVHDGDNPNWAQPDFDDSTWPLATLDAPALLQPGWRWYRIRLHLSGAHPPLALLVTGGDGTWEMVLNGAAVPGPAVLRPLRVRYPASRIVPLNLTGGDIEIALRTFVPESTMFLADRGAFRVEIGTLPAIESSNRAATSLRLNQLVLSCAVGLMQCLAGIGVLFLFRIQKDHREYLWLGLFLILHAVVPCLFLLATFGFLPFSTNWFITDPSLWLASIAQIEFTFSFVGQRVNRLWRIYEAILVAYPACFLVPAWDGLITRSNFDIGETLLVMPVAVFMPILLFIWYRRGYREATWLILPSLLPIGSIAINSFGIAASYMGWNRLAHVGDGTPIGPFQLYDFSVADLLFLLAIGIVMFFRFTRVSQEQARAAAELDAAREIQQYLIPSRLPETPGLAIESVYQPSREVGGDFFQVLPHSSGATLIVVGDVAGKGLQAGMLAALIIGAIRVAAKFTANPAEILALLNERLQGRGLVTCLAMRIDGNGSVELANAGHLPPYVNGKELALDGVLPLGALPDTIFPTKRLQLGEGQSMVLVSDGVIEARNSSGDLFGFERTAAIVSEPAQNIARAASTFGQEDDITVLTLTLAGAPVHA